MKAIYYHTQVISGHYAGEADSFVTDVFFAFIFGAYTMLLWELGGGILSSVSAVISFLCLARAIYVTIEWVNDALNTENNTSRRVSAKAVQKPTQSQPAKKKKFTSRRFKMLVRN